MPARTTRPVPARNRRRAGVVRILVALVAGVAVTACAVLCTGTRPASGTSPAPAAPAAAPRPVAAQAQAMPAVRAPAVAADGTPLATGALFGGPADDPGTHFCSASVVTSTAGNMLMTAAHCVADGDGTPARSGMSFAPGYQNGVAPYGYWTVVSAAVDPAWRNGGDPDDDVAFLTVTGSGPAAIQQLTGAFRVGFDDVVTDAAVTAVGYNDDDQGSTVTTGTATPWSATQLELDAPGLSDGTSGGPWLTGSDDSEIIGVTGGYEQGGDSSDVSYAAALGAAIRTLYDQAGGVDRPVPGS